MTVAFVEPADDGGVPITDYRVTCTSPNGGIGERPSSNWPITVAGLTAAKIYTCTVAAMNEVGTGPVSTLSAPVVAPRTAPGVPTITAVTVGLRSISVTFTKPANDGGAPITNYLVACASTNDGVTRERAAFHSLIRVVGLTCHNLTRTVTASRCSWPSLPTVESGRAPVSMNGTTDKIG